MSLVIEFNTDTRYCRQNVSQMYLTQGIQITKTNYKKEQGLKNKGYNSLFFFNIYEKMLIISQLAAIHIIFAYKNNLLKPTTCLVCVPGCCSYRLWP